MPLRNRTEEITPHKANLLRKVTPRKSSHQANVNNFVPIPSEMIQPEPNTKPIKENTHKKERTQSPNLCELSHQAHTFQEIPPSFNLNRDAPIPPTEQFPK